MNNKIYLDVLRWGLIAIIKDILNKVANYGLEGKQSLLIRFYNHFDTNFLFDDDFTTITIQNNNQDIVCYEDSFSVNIKVNNFHKRITIPFEAVALFLDPSAKFGLEFGEVYDDYDIDPPKNKTTNKVKKSIIKFDNDNIIAFDENITTDKYFHYDGKNTEYSMDYLKISQKHLINVGKNLLEKLMNNELENNKSFFIQFKKNYPGVIIPNLQSVKNQDIIMISLREDFYQLKVNEDNFSVLLYFDGKLKNITVPFKAILNIWDPDSNFKLDLSFVDFLDEQLINNLDNSIIFSDFIN